MTNRKPELNSMGNAKIRGSSVDSLWGCRERTKNTLGRER